MSVQTSYSSGMAVAFEGMLADNGSHDIVSMRNNEASASIAFGRAVRFEGSTDDAGALLPSSESHKIAGIVVHSHAYSPSGDLDSTGVVAGGTLNVLRKGRIWAVARTAVAPGDRLWVRAVSSGTNYEVLGGLEDADDSTDMIDCTKQGVWLTTAAQGEFAVLEVDFTNEPD